MLSVAPVEPLFPVPGQFPFDSCEDDWWRAKIARQGGGNVHLGYFDEEFNAAYERFGERGQLRLGVPMARGDAHKIILISCLRRKETASMWCDRLG